MINRPWEFQLIFLLDKFTKDSLVMCDLIKHYGVVYNINIITDIYYLITNIYIAMECKKDITSEKKKTTL